MVMGSLNRIKGEVRGLSQGMDAMQLELSNFQPLAPNEEEVPDLGGAEQPLPPVIETSDHDLASLIRSVGMTSITDIERLVEGTSKSERLPAIRRGARPSRDSPIYRPYRGRFGVGKDHL